MPAPPNDPAYSSQWYLVNTGWLAARNHGVTQKRAPHITIIDTGVNLITDGCEMLNVKQYDCTAVGKDSNIVQETPIDWLGHGTSCASIAAATTGNDVQMAGVASFVPEAQVYVASLRVTTQQRPYEAETTQIVKALAWCADHHAERYGPGAISLSLGGGTTPLWASPTVQMLARTLNAHGDHLFVGAGNGSADLSGYPEGNVTVVQATDARDALASFSNTLSSPEAAPGVDIYSNWGGNRAILLDGTSEATPIYAGCVSLIQSVYPNVNAHKAAEVLLKTGKLTAQGKIIPQLDAALSALAPKPKRKIIKAKPGTRT
jgi:thermitase